MKNSTTQGLTVHTGARCRIYCGAAKTPTMRTYSERGTYAIETYKEFFSDHKGSREDLNHVTTN